MAHVIDVLDELKEHIKSINNTNDVRCFDNTDNEKIEMKKDEYFSNKYLIVFASEENASINTTMHHDVPYLNRLMVYLEFNDTYDEYLMIIMKNPSTFSHIKSDNAMNRIIRYIKKFNIINKFKGVFIMNLCTSRETNFSNNIQDKYNDMNKSVFSMIYETYNPKTIIGSGKNLDINDTYKYLLENCYLENSKCFNELADTQKYPLYCGNNQGGRGVNTNKMEKPYDTLNKYYTIIYNNDA